MSTKEQADFWRQELLKRLSPTARPSIENNRDYEDVVALLAAWMQATDEHLSAAENKVVTQLTEVLAPAGDWKFPVQTLAIPVDMKARTIDERKTVFRASGGPDNQWRACGEGWTRPTSLGVNDWMIERGQQTNQRILVCQIHTLKPDMRLLLPTAKADPKDGQQLAFVCGDDDVVTALAGAQWGVQHPGASMWQAVTVTRYRDYMRFERGLAGSRSRQGQLAAWLPPFYPYSRKFLRFALTEPEETLPAAEWESITFGRGQLRLAAKIDAQTAREVEALARKIEALRNGPIEAARSPLILNAAPVCQMQMEAHNLLVLPTGHSGEFKHPIGGTWGVVAATVQETYEENSRVEASYPPAGLSLVKTKFKSRRLDEMDAEITCGQPSKISTGYQLRLYYGCNGQDVVSPRVLSSDLGDFTTPFPTLGGKNAPVNAYGDAGARHAWYNAYLRAPQPTGADILEILNQIPSCKEYLVLDDRGSSGQPGKGMIQLDIDNRPRAERTAWENYLWPTLVSDETLLEMRASFLSASQVAIMPRMRLHFKKQPRAELPSFLWREMERYTASVLSQYFMIGWYRLEGVVG